MPKHACIVEYKGESFLGFQRNGETKTVQKSLEETIQIVLREPVKVYTAGRTDTGVHATGMVIHFSSTLEISNFHKFVVGVNSLLHSEAAILGITKVPETFHARFSCVARQYEYWIYAGKYPRPLLENRAFCTHQRIDWDLFRSELQTLVGEHDFRAFSKTSSNREKSTIREIQYVQLEACSKIPGLFIVTIRANGFLHNMIRVLVGTLLDIAVGKKGNVPILEILNQKNRTLSGKTLSPKGLYFVKAFYPFFPEIETLYGSIL